MNKERYGVSLRSQSACWKKRNRITPNTDTFYIVTSSQLTNSLCLVRKIKNKLSALM